MFSRKVEKPLPPVATLPVKRTAQAAESQTAGILLGQGVYWNPEALPNAHIVCIGASGSGKTQTLKGICFALRTIYRTHLTSFIMVNEGIYNPLT